jgi:hypothetical protein
MAPGAHPWVGLLGRTSTQGGYHGSKVKPRQRCRPGTACLPELLHKAFGLLPVVCFLTIAC